MKKLIDTIAKGTEELARIKAETGVEHLTSCALLAGMGLDPDTLSDHGYRAGLLESLNQQGLDAPTWDMACPLCKTSADLVHLIDHLAYGHKLSMPRIIGWLRIADTAGALAKKTAPAQPAPDTDKPSADDLDGATTEGYVETGPVREWCHGCGEVHDAPACAGVNHGTGGDYV